MPVSDPLFQSCSCTAFLAFALIQFTVFYLLHMLHPLSSMPVSSDFPFRRNSFNALLFLILIQLADSYFFHASHLRFINSWVVSCFFFHDSARLYLFMRCILSHLSFIIQALFIHALHSASPCIYQQARSFMFRRYKQIGIKHSAFPYGRSLV